MLIKELKDKFTNLNNKTINVPLNDEGCYAMISDCIMEFSHLMLLYSCKNESAFSEYSKVFKKAHEALNRKTRGGYKEVKAIIYSTIALLLQRESLIYADCN